jgi:hypothetical protein
MKKDSKGCDSVFVGVYCCLHKKTGERHNSLTRWGVDTVNPPVFDKHHSMSRV